MKRKLIIITFTMLSFITGCSKNTLGINEVKETLETKYNITINSIEEDEVYKDYGYLVSSYKIITSDNKIFYAGVKEVTIGGFVDNEYYVIDNYTLNELRKVINNKYDNLYWENYYLYKEISSDDFSAMSWNLQIKLNSENDINSVFIQYQDILNTFKNLNIETNCSIYSSISFRCDGDKGRTGILVNGEESFSNIFYEHDLDEKDELTTEQFRAKYYNFCK